MPAPKPNTASLKPRSETICSLANPTLTRSIHARTNSSMRNGMVRLAILV